MPKQGAMFDYDSHAQKHVKDVDICIVCGNKLQCRWTDYNGEGVCLTCGTPYQLINGTDEQIKNNNYPYCNLRNEWIPIVKEYFEETKKFTFLGTSFSETTGSQAFAEWVKKNYPEMIKKTDE